jgi:hypothetical protein
MRACSSCKISSVALPCARVAAWCDHERAGRAHHESPIHFDSGLRCSSALRRGRARAGTRARASRTPGTPTGCSATRACSGCSATRTTTPTPRGRTRRAAAPGRGPPLPCGRATAEPRRPGLLDVWRATFARHSRLDVWCSLCFSRPCSGHLVAATLSSTRCGRPHAMAMRRVAASCQTSSMLQPLRCSATPSSCPRIMFSVRRTTTPPRFDAAAEHAGWPAASAM